MNIIILNIDNNLSETIYSIHKKKILNIKIPLSNIFII